jgi:undecaprenyl-diphosphatase
MSIVQAIILAIIEGITEFLPISSTGHMIIGSAFMGIANSPFVKMFTVAIQFGAILSVLVLYWNRFFKSFDFYVKLIIAFIPAAVFGLLLNDFIDSMLESPMVVAISLIIGGVFLLFVDKIFVKNELDQSEEQEISNSTALKIGFFQVIAMIPGVSRSAATIVGGLTQKLNRKNAAEFSFFLAVPTMLAATAYKMLKYQLKYGFSSEDMGILALGNVVAFIVALFSIKALISYLTKYGFKLFGYYRIALGSLIIILLLLGIGLEV